MMRLVVRGNVIHGFKLCVRIFWFVLLWGCLSPIDFETENVGGKIVVSGQISTLPEQNFVQLGRTADSERLPFPISGAYVTLYDDQGKFFSYVEDTSNPGIYLLPDISGVPGRTYHIMVVTPDGESYDSGPEKMAATPGDFATSYEIVREEHIDNEGIATVQPFMKIYANSTLPTAPDYFVRWSCIEAFLLSPTDFPDPFGNVPPPCYIVQNADPQRIVLLNAEDLKTTTVENLMVISRLVDWSFYEKHYFTVFQSAMTSDAIEYWRKVDILANQVGSIFDTPPAEINGNIKNLNNQDEKVFGYFQAVNETFHRLLLYKEDLPFPLLMPKCTFDNRDYISYPARCLDCTSVRNSTYTRPPYF